MNNKAVPEHRKQQMKLGQQTDSKQVMFQSNQLEFFYGEEETSDRVYKVDRFLNGIYNILKLGFLTFALVVGYRHFKQ